jgi:2-polyprenyl-3-methyl-5-hydroxy-6-metoxy-1,4-benzoquinol methylase
MNLRAGDEASFDEGDIAALANDIFFQSALQTTIICGATLELFLTRLRASLLFLAAAKLDAAVAGDDAAAMLLCALAQQCFLNEYVYVQSDEETRLAARLRDMLLRALSAGTEIPLLLLAAVAAYFPLHALVGAPALLDRQWPPVAADLLQQQLREPLEEADIRRTIPTLTPVDDDVSLRVMRQYEENPYPRWNIDPLAAVGTAAGGGHAVGSPAQREQTILIAGCGTGEHPFDIARKAPHARILAIDLSRASLAYAQRKTREHGLRNIEYAQADILKLGEIGRTFDRIEAMGVLHHLADPQVGWRILLSLLAPDGIMRVGLYSATARRAIAEARALIAANGYRAVAEDIRAFRRTLIRARDDPRWETILTTVDFYSMSGCRDMLFNVMEHRFTIAEIAAFLGEQRLSFLGFELDAKTVEKFQRQYPGADALLDLGCWRSFEETNPQTFRNMYQFSIRKSAMAA